MTDYKAEARRLLQNTVLIRELREEYVPRIAAALEAAEKRGRDEQWAKDQDMFKTLVEQREKAKEDAATAEKRGALIGLRLAAARDERSSQRFPKGEVSSTFVLSMGNHHEQMVDVEENYAAVKGQLLYNERRRAEEVEKS